MTDDDDDGDVDGDDGGDGDDEDDCWCRVAGITLRNSDSKQ